MLLVNGSILIENPPKGHPLEGYAKEYQKGINELKTRFPEGVITLKRIGYPKKVNKDSPGADGLVLLPPEAPPIYMNLNKTVGNDMWAYCKGAPHKDADTGFHKIPKGQNYMEIAGETVALDLKAQPDYVFFFWFKSGQIGSNFSVHEPEATRLSLLKEEQARKRVSALIIEMDEAKLETMCLAWEVNIYKDKKNQVRKPVEFLRDDLERLVFKMEEEKKKDKTNLMARGVDEFLKDVKSDEITRPKAIIQQAVLDGKMVYDTKNGHWYFDGLDLCFVPFTKQDRAQRQEFLAQFLYKSENADKWLHILKEMITREYVDSCDKYGIRWLCQQFEIPLNQTQEDLKKELTEKLFPEKVSTENV